MPSRALSLPEIAFVGRSNAGKSSLINALTGRNALARVSQSPGRTRQINFFQLGNVLMLVDLPGYSYAQVSKALAAEWQRLIFDYLRGRPNLKRVILLIDARRGIMDVDSEAMTLLDKAAVSYLVVLTKTDKLSPAERDEVRHRPWASRSKDHVAAYPDVLVTSSLTGDGARFAAMPHRGAGGLNRAFWYKLRDFLEGAAHMALQDDATQDRNMRVMARWRSTARVLVEALPYILRYDRQIIVVKYGGHAMDAGGASENFAQDIVLMKQTGIDPVVVHGGGPQIGAMLKRLQIPSSFVDGLRVTDAAAIEVVEMVLTGSINKQIVSGINAAGGRAVGLSGKDGNLVVARKLERMKIDPATLEQKPVDLGFVGEPETINPEVLRTIINSDLIPVIAPIGVGAKGETFNINADTVAGSVAGAMSAARLLLLTDVEGVLDKEGKLIPRLTVGEARALIADGTISGGMIPKIETAIDAVEAGVKAAVILDGRIPHVLLLELFTEHGAGTMITAE